MAVEAFVDLPGELFGLWAWWRPDALVGVLRAVSRVGVAGSDAGAGQRGEAIECGGEICCPGPGFGDTQPGSSGRAGEAGRDVQEAVAQFLRFRCGEVAVQQQGLGPGE